MLTFFVTDKEFLARMVRLAGPITLQQLVTVLLGLIDMLMIGQLGDTAVAGVGLANQVFFLAYRILVIIALLLAVRVSNKLLLIGVLRSGGDLDSWGTAGPAGGLCLALAGVCGLSAGDG